MTHPRYARYRLWQLNDRLLKSDGITLGQWRLNQRRIALGEMDGFDCKEMVNAGGKASASAAEIPPH
ncbi:MAG: hypothetical protein AAFX78_03475 [Cyanobacteria bacterium J06638_20]